VALGQNPNLTLGCRHFYVPNFRRIKYDEQNDEAIFRNFYMPNNPSTDDQSISSMVNCATLPMTSFAEYLCLATLIYGSHSRQRWLAGTFPASFAAARFRFQGFSL